MSAPSVPSIPPRPVRSQKESRPSGVGLDAPRIPPRPARAMDRSSSPHRDSFARSPLNKSTFALSGGGHNLAQALNATSPTPTQDESTLELPSIGQEGTEYAAFFEKQPQGATSASEPRLASTATPTTTTRNVVRDIELHAPKPALPTSSAKARIATVTRTDSSQAAAAGIGRAHEDDKDPIGRSLKTRASFASENSLVSSERTPSTQPGDVEHGIPEIGQRVPMYPNAGDVQAPSPAPFGGVGTPSAAGVLVEAHQRSGRHHRRTRSSRDHLQPPPGSYGLHGHGTPSHDRFERAWYEKHPEALEHEEHGEYGPGIGGGRGEFALSREELDRIVRETASKGAGVGTSPAVLGTPLEEIGYIASESYTAKLASPRPASTYQQQSHTPSDAPVRAQTHTDSPLRKDGGSTDLDQEAEAGEETGRPGSQPHESSGKAAEGSDDDNVIHIDPPAHRSDMIGGGGGSGGGGGGGSGGYDPPAEDLGPSGGNAADEGGWVDERGYGVPILASDEVAKEPGSEHMYPAVSPPLERSASELQGGWDPDAHWSHVGGISRTESRNSSMSGSRPTSMVVLNPGYPRHLVPDEAEDAMGTPLEDVEEYEPLFPDQEDDEDGDDDDDDRARSGPASRRQAKRRFPLRPDLLLKQRFPSEDVWEDAPSSAQLQATITTPPLIEDDAQTIIADKDDERAPAPDVDRSRPEGDMPRVRSEDDGLDLPRRHFKSDVPSELPERPMSKQRFPGRDIWEDSPASLQLETVVSTLQPDDVETPVDTPVDADKRANAVQSPAKEKAGPPAVPARPSRPKKSSPVGMSPQPGIPQRPAKPVAPADPESDAAASPRRQDTADGSPTLQTEPPTEPGKMDAASASSLPSAFASARRATPPMDRPRPPVPARPSKPAVGDGSAAAPLTRPSASVASKAFTGSASEGGGSSAAAGSAIPPAPRPKSAVPARPNGSKIASLKAGFMSDLDKRLQMGPRAVKSPEKAADEAGAEKEKEKEKAPLSDIRKGRARGPARRRPGTSPSTVAPEGGEETPSTRLGIAQTRTLWQITGDGRLDVAGDRLSPSSPSPDAKLDGGPALATDTAAGTLDESRARSSEHPDEAKTSVPVGQAEAVPGLTSTAPAKPTSPTEKAVSPSPTAAAPTDTIEQVSDGTTWSSKPQRSHHVSSASR